MSGSIHRRGLLLGVLALAVAGFGVSQVIGAIPNPGDGRFYACFKKASGAVRVIDYPKVKGCPKGQKLIDWGRSGPQGPAGPGGGQGPGGPQGPDGPQGDQGGPGISKITLTVATSLSDLIQPETFGSAVATCPAGKVVGGGHDQVSNPESFPDYFTSRPFSPNQWLVEVWNNDDSTPHQVRAWAICMTTDPGTVIASAGKFKGGKKGNR